MRKEVKGGIIKGNTIILIVARTLYQLDISESNIKIK